MSHPISLSFLTVFDADVLQSIKIAADTCYNAIGLRLLPAAASGEDDYPILTDNQLLKDARSLLKDTNLSVADIEIVRLKADTDVKNFTGFFERGAELGAKHVLVAGDDRDISRLTDSYAKLCALAQQYDLTCDLEFMPWTAVPDLIAARDIVLSAGAENGGVLIDALHFDRSKSKIEDIATIPLKHIHYVQLCDGLADYDSSDEGLIDVARNSRLFPGEGAIDIGGIIRSLPNNVPLSIEVPKRALAKSVSAHDRAKAGFEATQRLLQAIGRS
jgi:sugar phosphate isomerase/epimerase